MAGYLYSPPTWNNVQLIEGSLRRSVTTSTTVYRVGGVWHNVLTPGMDDPIVPNCDKASDGTLCYFNRPTVVPTELYAGLAALQPADSSWSPGTLTAL